MTFFIPKKYLSTGIVYPANSHTQDDLLSNPQFGYEIETEQLLQLMESKTMREKTIREFALYDYYDLDTNNKNWNSIITKKYIQDVEFFRSPYLSVVINVRMTDPELAARVANFQIDEINKYRASIFEENRKSRYENAVEEYNQSKLKLSALKDSIYAENKGDKLLFNFIENLNNENYDASEFVQSEQMEEWIEEYIYENKRLKGFRETKDNYEKSLERPLPSIYTIDSAVPSYEKVSPSFLLNGIIGAVVLAFIALTIRISIDQLSRLKNEG